MPLYDDIMSSLNELIEAGENGTEMIERRLSVLDVPAFTPDQIRAIRKSADMTQEIFAACIGINVGTVKAWEAGNRQPSGAACRLLGLMQNNPHFAEDVGIITR